MASLIFENRVMTFGDIQKVENGWQVNDTFWHNNVSEGFILIQQEPPFVSQTGWLYQNGTFVEIAPVVPPKEPLVVPDSVTPRQAQILAVLSPSFETKPKDWDDATQGQWKPVFSTLLERLNFVLDQLPEPQRTLAKITWEKATIINRNNPLIEQVTQHIGGLPSVFVDCFFVAAASIPDDGVYPTKDLLKLIKEQS